MVTLSNKNKVLLVAPSYMNLYEDIRDGLTGLGYTVTYYPDLRIPGDPFNKARKYETKLSKSEFIEKIDAIWSEILQKDENQGFYDFLLVVDGLSVPPSLITRLKSTNPNLVACNYLYDRIRGVYEVDRNFAYYDRIFSFDLSDSKEYHLHFLPIYWIPMEKVPVKKQDVFGFGGMDKYRLEVFRHIRREVKKINKSSFIKIYYFKDSLALIFIKNFVKCILGRPGFTLSDILSGLITNKALTPKEFRKMIYSSDVILDTNHPYQDGLTARFMWALGAEKKIITTNKSIRDYSFYSREQVYILNEDGRSISDFLNSHFEMNEDLRNRISFFKIDKWLTTILFFRGEDCPFNNN